MLSTQRQVLSSVDTRQEIADYVDRLERRGETRYDCDAGQSAITIDLRDCDCADRDIHLLATTLTDTFRSRRDIARYEILLDGAVMSDLSMSRLRRTIDVYLDTQDCDHDCDDAGIARLQM